VLISKNGRVFRKNVYADVLEQHGLQSPMEGRLSVHIELFVPDKRKRDIDNYAKALLDALTHAGVWRDDEQVDRLLITREKQHTLGRAYVTVTQI
jgi:crossover junction endodeoxyribonuclease RusA